MKKLSVKIQTLNIITQVYEKYNLFNGLSNIKSQLISITLAVYLPHFGRIHFILSSYSLHIHHIFL